MAEKMSLADLRKAAVEEVKTAAKELVGAIREDVETLRESAPAKVLDNVVEMTDKFLGPSGKAWMANGLEELRQAVALGNGQVHGGNQPGLWGTITTGEATYDRMGEFSLDDLRAASASRANAEVKEQTHEMERE